MAELTGTVKARMSILFLLHAQGHARTHTHKHTNTHTHSPLTLQVHEEEEEEVRLLELQQEHVLMKAQLQEMQALERSLDAAQQDQRVQQQLVDAAAMRNTK